MTLPAVLRHHAPDRIRHSPRVRALALWTRLIPPRAMHTAAEAELLEELTRDRRSVVEIGVYEGASAIVLARALSEKATLHLVDPFSEGGSALRPGQRAAPRATRLAVRRAIRGPDAPTVRWHIDYSQRLAERWQEPVDLVFVDGDHSEAGCRADWDGWYRFVTGDGVVVFHDARATQPGGRGLPGPTAVVDSLFRGDGGVSGWRILAERDSLVAVTRR